MNLTDTNKGLFNESAFNKMKNSAILINTARGGLIDEQALLRALDENQFAMYAADVLEVEPPAADHLFLQHEKIIITPHIGAYNHECNEMMCASVLEDITRVSNGKEPVHRLMQ